MMKIMACIKQVPDPETPSTEYRIDQAAKAGVISASLAARLEMDWEREMGT